MESLGLPLALHDRDLASLAAICAHTLLKNKRPGYVHFVYRMPSYTSAVPIKTADGI